MPTFLQLVKKVASESRTVSPKQITTVVDRDGRVAKFVEWVQEAWVSIQNEREDWEWMKGEFENLQTIPGTRRYTAATFSLDRLAVWPKEIWLDGNPIHCMDWNTFYQMRLQAQDGTGKPTAFAVSPKNELVLSPVPDKAYAFSGMYRKSPQILEADDDVPEMPARFHDLIVKEALDLLSTHDESFNQKQFWLMKSIKLRNELNRDQLPEITISRGPF